MKVFLGGTVAGSKWRNSLIPKLEVEYFNPEVEIWTDEAYQRELYERKNCDYCLYVLSPKMEGWYSIAEVTDDSYKKPDKTIYCFLEKDDNKAFNEQQIKELNALGKLVTNNGGIWHNSLDQVANFLNSASKVYESQVFNSKELKDVFISYGRRHSLGFAQKLHDDLVKEGKTVWFDMNDIPLGVDFQEQIDDGIRKADNFIYVISPHSVKSIYCLKEVVLALKYNKRIIPILHIEPTDCWDKMHPIIAKLNWIYLRQTENFEIPLAQWQFTDDYKAGFSGLLALLKKQESYVRQHTILLDNALFWTENQESTNFLLVGEKRKNAEKWLLKRKFVDDKGKKVQQPCLPTSLHARYICESKKNAENLMTDVFLSYDRKDIKVRDEIRELLSNYAITTWSDTKDINTGSKFEKEIEDAIIEADNFLFLISPESIKSEYCLLELKIAKANNKRIIPLLIKKTPLQDITKSLQSIQYLDFTDRNSAVEIRAENQDEVIADVNSRKNKSPFEIATDDLLKTIFTDKSYYEQHKILLTQATKWKEQNHNPSILLRGHKLENAETWLIISNTKPIKATALQKEFIDESQRKSGMLGSEVFISYSRSDGDFARKINNDLQFSGKTTWFDQESIASSSDFQDEIHKGIESSNNFLFVLSPDAINSPYCYEEVEYARKLNKKVVTILLKTTPQHTIPETLSTVQWIDFKDNDYHSAYSELLRTLDLDREYVQRHTKYSQYALEWIANKKDDSFLVRGTEYILAEKWLKNAYGITKAGFSHLDELNPLKKPTPTALQIEFIARSQDANEQRKIEAKKRKEKILRLEQEKAREAEARLEEAETAKKRQKIFIILVSLALFFALIFGYIALDKSSDAEKSIKDASTQSMGFAAKLAFAQHNISNCIAYGTKAYMIAVPQPKGSVIQNLNFVRNTVANANDSIFIATQKFTITEDITKIIISPDFSKLATQATTFVPFTDLFSVHKKEKKKRISDAFPQFFLPNNSIITINGNKNSYRIFSDSGIKLFEHIFTEKLTHLYLSHDKTKVLFETKTGLYLHKIGFHAVTKIYNDENINEVSFINNKELIFVRTKDNNIFISYEGKEINSLKLIYEKASTFLNKSNNLRIINYNKKSAIAINTSGRRVFSFPRGTQICAVSDSLILSYTKGVFKVWNNKFKVTNTFNYEISDDFNAQFSKYNATVIILTQQNKKEISTFNFVTKSVRRFKNAAFVEALSTPDWYLFLPINSLNTIQLGKFTSKPISVAKTEDFEFTNLEFTKNGKNILAQTSENNAFLYNLSGKVISIFRPDSGTIVKNSFLPDFEQDTVETAENKLNIFITKDEKKIRYHDFKGKTTKEINFPAKISHLFRIDTTHILVSADSALFIADTSGILQVLNTRLQKNISYNYENKTIKLSTFVNEKLTFHAFYNTNFQVIDSISLPANENISFIGSTKKYITSSNEATFLVNRNNAKVRLDLLYGKADFIKLNYKHNKIFYISNENELVYVLDTLGGLLFTVKSHHTKVIDTNEFNNNAFYTLDKFSAFDGNLLYTWNENFSMTDIFCFSNPITQFRSKNNVIAIADKSSIYIYTTGKSLLKWADENITDFPAEIYEKYELKSRNFSTTKEISLISEKNKLRNSLKNTKLLMLLFAIFSAVIVCIKTIIQVANAEKKILYSVFYIVSFLLFLGMLFANKFGFRNPQLLFSVQLTGSFFILLMSLPVNVEQLLQKKHIQFYMFLTVFCGSVFFDTLYILQERVLANATEEFSALGFMIIIFNILLLTLLFINRILEEFKKKNIFWATIVFLYAFGVAFVLKDFLATVVQNGILNNRITLTFLLFYSILVSFYSLVRYIKAKSYPVFISLLVVLLILTALSTVYIVYSSDIVIYNQKELWGVMLRPIYIAAIYAFLISLPLPLIAALKNKFTGKLEI